MDIKGAEVLFAELLDPSDSAERSEAETVTNIYRSGKPSAFYSAAFL